MNEIWRNLYGLPKDKELWSYVVKSEASHKPLDNDDRVKKRDHTSRRLQVGYRLHPGDSIRFASLWWTVLVYRLRQVVY